MRQAAEETLQLDLFGGQADDALVWRHPRANRQCRVGEAVVAYEFKRGQRRTIGLSVGPLGLSVRAPRWAPVADVEAFIQTKGAWVLDKLRQVQEAWAQRVAPAALARRRHAGLPGPQPDAGAGPEPCL